MTNYFVYTHTRLDTENVFYVGKGKLCRGKPYRATLKSNRNPHWRNIVNAAGFSAKILIDGIDEELAFLIEQEAIDVYRRRGVSLVNYTDGGEGTSGRVASEETKRKISESNKGKHNHRHTDETKQKIAEASRARVYTDDVRKRMSDAAKGKPKSLEHRRKISEYLIGKPCTEESKQNLRTKRWVTDGKKDYFVTIVDGNLPEGTWFGRVLHGTKHSSPK